MNNKKQTAIQQLIKILEYKKQTSVSSHLGCLDMCIRECQELLELEKQDIEDAYRVGKVEASMFKEKHITGEQYYNETYRGDIQSL